MVCKALKDKEHTQWTFCPNLAASIVLTILFLITMIVHIWQAAKFKKGYCWVIIMSAIWQFACYFIRDLSIIWPNAGYFYDTWFILILTAPLWTNAFVYMVMGRMIWNYKSPPNVFGIKAWNIGYMFVGLDLVAFVVQVFGAATASNSGTSDSQVLRGLHIYMGGTGLQLFFIGIFMFFSFSLFRSIRSQQSGKNRHDATILMITMWAVLGLIVLRIIFRLIEYSNGLHSTIPQHEVYQYILDTTPMLIALIILNVVHPGRIMAGPGSDLPSRKDRKRGKEMQPPVLPEYNTGHGHSIPMNRNSMNRNRY